MPSENDTDQIWVSRSHPVQEDMDFQRANWRAERWGWLILAVIVVLALLGLFAYGPLSFSTATGAAGRLEIQYERFGRSGAPMRMRMEVRAPGPRDTTIRIGASFMEAFVIENMSPRPVEERGGPEGIEMVFRSAGGAPLRVYLDLQPQTVGPVRSEIATATAGDSPARLTQFIFP